MNPFREPVRVQRPVTVERIPSGTRTELSVDMAFDPPWDRVMMSDAALLTLGL